MSGVPNVFGSATSSIPLSQLDVNFNTPVTIGNTTVGLGNTVTSFGNVTLTNTTVTVGNVTTDLTVHGLTVGQGGGSVSTNTAVGASALAANTSGALNTAFGTSSLQANTTASNNTAVGYQAGYSNTIGGSGVCIGAGAGYTNVGGGGNTFVGASAGNLFTAASGATYNAFFGAGSGSAVTSGQKNTIIGGYSGNQGGLNITTSSNYIVLSDGDGNPRVAVNNNGNTLFGGLNIDPTFNRVNGVNIANNGSILTRSAAGLDIGLSVTSGFNINFYTDNGSARVAAGTISSNGSVTAFNVTSDYRLKKNVAPLQNSLAKVLQLKPCSYNYIEGNQYSEGFIAHELAEICPEAVTGEKDAINENGSIKAQGVDTSFLVATLTAAIQELKADFDSLKAQINGASA